MLFPALDSAKEQYRHYDRVWYSGAWKGGTDEKKREIWFGHYCN